MTIKTRIANLEKAAGDLRRLDHTERYDLTVWADEKRPGLYCTADGETLTREKVQELSATLDILIIHGREVGELSEPAHTIQIIERAEPRPVSAGV